MIIRALVTFICFVPMICYGQTPSKGRVLDDNLKPIIVSVLNKATNSKAYTDIKGDYKIKSSIGDTLQFLSIGLTPENRIVEDSVNKINVILINKDVNCLGAVWDERDYKKAYRLIDQRYIRLYLTANRQKLW